MPVHADGNTCCKALPLPDAVACHMAAAAATLLSYAATLLPPTLHHCSAALPLSSFLHYHQLIVAYKL